MTDRDWCNAQPDAAELNEAFDLARASGVITQSTIASLIHKLQAARVDSERIEALRLAADKEGRVEITLFANDMWEMSGLWEEDIEDPDGVPALHNSLDDLLDHLVEVMRTRSGRAEDVTNGELPNG